MNTLTPKEWLQVAAVVLVIVGFITFLIGLVSNQRKDPSLALIFVCVGLLCGFFSQLL